MRYTRLDMSKRVPVVILILGFFLTSPGHDSLYNYVEIQIHEESLSIEFSVHAAEIAGDLGIDPTETDTSWFLKLSEDETKSLLTKADQFISQSYRISGNSFPLDDDGSLAIHFEEPQTLRKMWRKEVSTRPGSLPGKITSSQLPAAIQIEYLNPEKRLLLVINRPGAFPKAYDIAPGESKKLTLSP